MRKSLYYKNTGFLFHMTIKISVMNQYIAKLFYFIFVLIINTKSS